MSIHAAAAVMLYTPSNHEASMTELSDYNRHLWTTRFERYTDAELLDWWKRAGEEPCAVDELALEQIRARNLDI